MVGIETHPLYPLVAGGAVGALITRGDTDGAIQLARGVLAARDVDASRSASVAAPLLVALNLQGRQEEAARTALELLRTHDGIGDQWSRLLVRVGSVGTLLNGGGLSVDDVGALAEETVKIARQLGNPTLLVMGLVHARQQPDRAVGFLEESLGLAEDVVSSVVMAVLGNLSLCYAQLGDATRAAANIRKAMLYARDGGSPQFLVGVLDYGGQALIALSHDEPGTVMLSASSHGRIASRVAGGHLQSVQRQSHALAVNRLGLQAYNAAMAKGADMTADAAVAYTLTVVDALTQDQDVS
jgi:hypothetical protein